MVGEMRNLCFDDRRIGRHAFLESLSIPIRRFAKEQVAAQLVAQVFSLSTEDDFTRARHVELQRFFQAVCGDSGSRARVDRDSEQNFRYVAYSVCGDSSATDEPRDCSFGGSVCLEKMRCTTTTSSPGPMRGSSGLSFADLSGSWRRDSLWMRSTGIFVEFQRHVTQAAVEKPALRGRDRIIADSFEMWTRSGDIPGDARFRERGLGDPNDLCQQE